MAFPVLCRRDERWLDEATQYDLSSPRETLTSHRRYTKLQVSNPDRQ